MSSKPCSGTCCRIRPMSAADLTRVLEIAASLPKAPNWPAPVYAAAVEAAGTPMRVALVAEQTSNRGGHGSPVVAFAIASLVPPEAELETIAVFPEVQRQGVGRQLLAALIAELAGKQVKSLILEVRESNGTARNFYQAGGFAETARRRRYYADPEEDAILMELKWS